ncbi:hypothetical protein ACFL3D_03490 [Candidatus Omnitrophota bacterium]
MNKEIIVLAVTAATIGFFHTLFGPDHYIPFITIAKARQWNYRKTLLITLLCGIGHVGSSIILGLVGVSCGLAVIKLEVFESFRGDWAAWALICFGLLYAIYGVRKAFITKSHEHKHIHTRGEAHSHLHIHAGNHTHIHADEHEFHWTPWALFVIFVLGPCEPLIPVLMYPAANESVFGMFMVAGIFSIVTISTMMGMVIVGVYGLSFVPLKRMERYSHALAGSAIMMCGCSIIFLGL